jgi:hypothetical protein
MEAVDFSETLMMPECMAYTGKDNNLHVPFGEKLISHMDKDWYEKYGNSEQILLSAKLYFFAIIIFHIVVLIFLQQPQLKLQQKLQ